MIHKQTNLSKNYQVFFCELELKMNEVELSEEKISYPTGTVFCPCQLSSVSYLGEMLGDMGGVFGFFLGVTMLNCLQNTWDYLKRWQHSILRLVLTFDHLFKTN